MIDLDFVLVVTRQQDVPMILKGLIVVGGFAHGHRASHCETLSLGYSARDESTVGLVYL